MKNDQFCWWYAYWRSWLSKAVSNYQRVCSDFLDPMTIFGVLRHADPGIWPWSHARVRSLSRISLLYQYLAIHSLWMYLHFKRYVNIGTFQHLSSVRNFVKQMWDPGIRQCLRQFWSPGARLHCMMHLRQKRQGFHRTTRQGGFFHGFFQASRLQVVVFHVHSSGFHFHMFHMFHIFHSTWYPSFCWRKPQLLLQSSMWFFRGAAFATIPPTIWSEGQETCRVAQRLSSMIGMIHREHRPHRFLFQDYLKAYCLRPNFYFHQWWRCWECLGCLWWWVAGELDNLIASNIGGTTCAFFGLPIPNDAKEQLNPVQGDFPRGAAAAGNLSSLSSRRY